MNYVMIFHANLNYAYLTPDRYEHVIRNAYELIIDTMRECFPHVKYVFEASGYTINEIAQRTPDVLKKLKFAIACGQCEFMGSPYAHPMLPNFPEEDGLWSLKFSQDMYDRHLDLTPKSFWNPECGWRSYVPRQIVNCHYKNLLGDFEAYSISRKPDDSPQRPEIFEVEHTDEKHFYNFGFSYDLPGDEKTLHFPFKRTQSVGEKLRTFLRSDRICQFGVRYFMDMEGYSLQEYMELIKKYSQQRKSEPAGALVIFADDAEYIGTNGWFKLKYKNQPDDVFEVVNSAKQKLIDLVNECLKIGTFVTFDYACNKIEANDETVYFDDDSAWHGAKASAWADTPMAKLLRPWQNLVRKKLHQISSLLSDYAIERAWFHLTNSYNSDGQWPPTLPAAPHIIHPFNYSYCFENLLQAERIVGGVDRSRLEISPAKTLNDILGIQQNIVLEKALKLALAYDESEAYKARQAIDIIERFRDCENIKDSRTMILYPSEYKIRAEALIEARKLVGGIKIEEEVTS